MFSDYIEFIPFYKNKNYICR